jgi:hypothetical protein
MKKELRLNYEEKEKAMKDESKLKLPLLLVFRKYDSQLTELYEQSHILEDIHQ